MVAVGLLALVVDRVLSSGCVGSGDLLLPLLTGGIQQGPHLFSSLVAVDKQVQVSRKNGAGLFAAVTQQEEGRHLSDGGGQ